MRLGVLALQGAVSEHLAAFEQALAELGRRGEVVPVRSPGQLEGLAGLALPGGESTTIHRLLLAADMAEPLRRAVAEGMGVLATCAGAILMARKVNAGESNAAGLGLMEMAVARNAFGRQKQSFEAALKVEGLAAPFPALFIRAPAITACWGGCQPLARLDSTIVACRQDKLWALSFHPELAHDSRLHQAFIQALD